VALGLWSEGWGEAGLVALHHPLISLALVASKMSRVTTRAVSEELTRLWTRNSLIHPPLILTQAPLVELNLVLLFAAGGKLSSAEIGAEKGNAHLPRCEAVVLFHVRDQNLQLHGTVYVQPFDGLSMLLPCRIWHSLGPFGPLGRSSSVWERT